MITGPTFHPLRDYQEQGIEYALAKARAHENLLLASPTGSGKSTVIAGLLARSPLSVVAVPNLSIGLGVLEAKKGPQPHLRKRSDSTIRGTLADYRIYTTLNLLNAVDAGEIGFSPGHLIIDEGHHAINDTFKGLQDLTNHLPCTLLTATPYRSTPDQTDELYKTFGRPHWLISEEECFRRGYTVLPKFVVKPILDDELIDIASGEFTVKGSTALFTSRIDAIAALINSYPLDTPTTVVLPSVEAVEALMPRIPLARAITAKTSQAEREEIFSQTLACHCILLQIRAVGEGVDVALRRMFDAAPTNSPNLWKQRVGRLTRPGGDSTYICLCHNLLRHGYLFEGLIPAAAFRMARKVWGEEWQPSRRIMARILGNTGLGRFQPEEITLADGTSAWLYCLKEKRGLKSYAALLVPGALEPYLYMREDALTGRTVDYVTPTGFKTQYKERQKGKWQRVNRLPDSLDCSSYPNEFVSPGATDWWIEWAGKKGLAADMEPTTRSLNLLGILMDTRAKPLAGGLCDG